MSDLFPRATTPSAYTVHSRPSTTSRRSRDLALLTLKPAEACPPVAATFIEKSDEGVKAAHFHKSLRSGRSLGASSARPQWPRAAPRHESMTSVEVEHEAYRHWSCLVDKHVRDSAFCLSLAHDRLRRPRCMTCRRSTYRQRCTLQRARRLRPSVLGVLLSSLLHGTLQRSNGVVRCCRKWLCQLLSLQREEGRPSPLRCMRCGSGMCTSRFARSWSTSAPGTLLPCTRSSRTPRCTRRRGAATCSVRQRSVHPWSAWTRQTLTTSSCSARGQP
jgi:hypothetical protein